MTNTRKIVAPRLVDRRDLAANVARWRRLAGSDPAAHWRRRERRSIAALNEARATGLLRKRRRGWRAAGACEHRPDVRSAACCRPFAGNRSTAEVRPAGADRIGKNAATFGADVGRPHELRRTREDSCGAATCKRPVPDMRCRHNLGACAAELRNGAAPVIHAANQRIAIAT